MPLDLIQLDPDGNVILSIESSDSSTCKRLLVSSAVLSVASQVFSKMFRSGFREAVEVQSECRPSISLKEDDPGTMEMIISLLHHQNDRVPDVMDRKSLALVAIHCDKYDCARALKPWISLWSSGCDMDACSTADDYGYMLLAAHLFRSNTFTFISKKAIENLAPGFVSTLEENEILTQLPEWVEGRLTLHSQGRQANNNRQTRRCLNFGDQQATEKTSSGTPRCREQITRPRWTSR